MDLPKLRREAKRIRDDEKPDLAAAKRLFDTAREQPDFAVASLVMMRHRGKLKDDDWADVARWAQGIESPEAADLFAKYVVAPLFDRFPEREQLARWTRSAEPLMRRLAARVAMHADDLDALAPLARDEDELVQEAIAQALHAKAERDEASVYEFLRAHPEAPRAMLRRAAAALTPAHALALTATRMPPKREGEGARARVAKPKPLPKASKKRHVSKAEQARRAKADEARAELAAALEAREEAERAVERAKSKVRDQEE